MSIAYDLKDGDIRQSLLSQLERDPLPFIRSKTDLAVKLIRSEPAERQNEMAMSPLIVSGLILGGNLLNGGGRPKEAARLIENLPSVAKQVTALLLSLPFYGDIALHNEYSFSPFAKRIIKLIGKMPSAAQHLVLSEKLPEKLGGMDSTLTDILICAGFGEQVRKIRDTWGHAAPGECPGLSGEDLERVRTNSAISENLENWYAQAAQETSIPAATTAPSPASRLMNKARALWRGLRHTSP